MICAQGSISPWPHHLVKQGVEGYEWQADLRKDGSFWTSQSSSEEDMTVRVQAEWKHADTQVTSLQP